MDYTSKSDNKLATSEGERGGRGEGVKGNVRPNGNGESWRKTNCDRFQVFVRGIKGYGNIRTYEDKACFKRNGFSLSSAKGTC